MSANTFDGQRDAPPFFPGFRTLDVDAGGVCFAVAIGLIPLCRHCHFEVTNFLRARRDTAHVPSTCRLALADHGAFRHDEVDCRTSFQDV